MSGKRKYQRGEPLQSVDDVMTAVHEDRWLWLEMPVYRRRDPLRSIGTRGAPKHPSFIANMAVAAVHRSIAGKRLFWAAPTDGSDPRPDTGDTCDVYGCFQPMAVRYCESCADSLARSIPQSALTIEREDSAGRFGAGRFGYTVRVPGRYADKLAPEEALWVVALWLRRDHCGWLQTPAEHAQRLRALGIEQKLLTAGEQVAS